LVNLNRNEEVFTITSQPSVNGVPSTDPVHGWGGAGGYVYQKAYLEFFVSQEKFEILVERISKTPSITYYVTSNDMVFIYLFIYYNYSLILINKIINQIAWS